jgi:hypothetical protein
MSRDIYVDVQRANASIPAVTNVYMQLDNLPLSEVLYYEGVAPVERFTAYTLAVYDIRQTDIVTDRTNIDPVTGTNYRYRIITIPEAFPDQHMEMNVDLLRGGV